MKELAARYGAELQLLVATGIQHFLLEMVIFKGVLRITFWKLYYLVCFQVPSLKRKMVAQMAKDNQMTGTSIGVEQWQDTVTSFKAWQGACKSFIMDMRKAAKQDGPVVDALVVKMDKTTCNIGDFQRPGRPLVIFFGRCS